MLVNVIKNRGYKWFTDGQAYIKGYFSFFNNTSIVYRESDALNELSKIHSYSDFKKLLENIEGSYAIIMKSNDEYFVAVDRARSIPIYYDVDCTILSDCADVIKNHLGDSVAIDDYSLATMCATNFVMGNDTVYRQIKQLDIGECVRFCKKEILKEKYYVHLEDIVDEATDILINKLENVSQRVFQRIKTAVGNRPVVLSMSGGYDSRFVACMLKKVGIEDVSCYSYGKGNSFEIEQAKKNASALGYRWCCVEYSDEEVKKVLDNTGKEYFSENNNHDFSAYIQNFPAVRKLHEEGWFKPNSVFITGLCGDMPTGFYVDKYKTNGAYTYETAANALYEIVYGRLRLKSEFYSKTVKRFARQLKELPIDIKDFQSWISAIDAIYTGTVHSRYYMHMNDVHDFFGYEWMMPFWDSELLGIWYSIPAEKRANQNLYSQWLLDDLCNPYGIGQKKTIVSHPKNKVKNICKHIAGGIINFILLHLNIPFKRSYDYNNFAPLELLLYKSLKTKRWVIYHKANLTLLLNQYILQSRYDIENIKEAFRHISKR